MGSTTCSDPGFAVLQPSLSLGKQEKGSCFILPRASFIRTALAKAAMTNSLPSAISNGVPSTVHVMLWLGLFSCPCVFHDRLVGLVVRRPPRERKIPGSNPACDGIFSGSSHTSDLNIGTPMATLPGAWRYSVSTGTGRPGVSIL